MIDALPSELRKDSPAATRHLHGRLIIGAVAALLVVAGAFAWRIAAGAPPAPVRPVATVAPPAKNPVLDELVETTKALQESQQQAIDQLQVLQQLVASQKAEARKSADEVAALSGKLDALRQSFASVSSASPEAADVPQTRKVKPATRRSGGKAHRTTSPKARNAATRH
jgi:hypothetical protein